MAKDIFPINGIDHLELYVGNAKQAAHYYRTALGFSLTGYSGLETGVRDRASYVLEQGNIRFVLTSPLTPSHPIHELIQRHGDGVATVALSVDDAKAAYEQTTSRGARGAIEPKTFTENGGSVTVSGIHIYGDTILKFVDRKNYTKHFLPEYTSIEKDTVSRPVGLRAVDHVVGNVELGKMNEWVKFFEQVLGFHLFVSFDDKDISTEYSALMSKVVASGSERIKFPINEPAAGKRKSQIDEYLEWYNGPGVQHIALLTADIVETVGVMRKQGVDFLRVPDSYYDDLETRIGTIEEPIALLRENGILVDRDEFGYMLQIFTKPIEDRPTLFLEVIQRRGGKSFGKGNFKALFEAIEREQDARGNL